MPHNTLTSVPTASSLLPELSREISEPFAVFFPSAGEIDTSDVGIRRAAAIVNHLAMRYQIHWNLVLFGTLFISINQSFAKYHVYSFALINTALRISSVPGC